ncbi:uncharacterized protein [Montipora capricornis]|uniref:uncharacterized protein n=1 Tax=Montipora capricornis TaxID=246305 RepID=UPI0035F21223
MSQFLKHRAYSVHSTIEARYANKFNNLSKEIEASQPSTINKENWVINISKKPLSMAERSILEKGPKFAPTPGKIPTKDIVAEVEASIVRLPEDTKDSIRTATASILRRTCLSPHNNISKAERKTLKSLKKDVSHVIMKSDKGNCFVVMDRTDYNEKMETLLSDHQTYQLVHKPQFAKIERDLNKKGKIDDSTCYKLRSTDAIPSAIRGSIKHHKAGHPLWPIVSCIGSALYNTSKLLTDILTPIHNLNDCSVSNSMDFTKQVANREIHKDEVMAWFDVISLFTAIPVDKACDYIRKKLDKDTTDKIISLLEFTLSNNCFMFNDSVYKQIHGCAMESPVSPVIANLCREVNEDKSPPRQDCQKSGNVT